ncbi:hypothetical protein DXC18_04745 [Collinsella sp. OM08-14AT]|nr:hypothetical protein DXC18_04745 [Collinsella sp. OM08-14AT]
MASKNLLPVAALCSALATGMPVAALATPAVDVPLPAVNCLATNQMSTIARQRFSLAQASISASGCLRRCTNSSMVVDTERSSTADGPLTGCIICTWRAAATDADGDSCDVELRLDITLSDDSADGATVAFDSTFFEDGGGVCLGCVPSSADSTQPAISFTASLKMTKAGTDATANGEIALMFYASGTESQEIRGKQRTGSLSLTRGADPGPVDISTQTQDVHHVLVDPALLEMEWSGVGAVGLAPSTGDIASDSSENSGEIAPGDNGTPGDITPPSSGPSATFSEPSETAADADGTQAGENLGYPIPTDIDEGNCCMMVALDRTETVDAASVGVTTDKPVRKAAIIAFPKTVEVVFLPSGEVVAPTLLTLLGAKGTANQIDNLTVVDPATTAKLRLYAVTSDGGKTEEFDGENLLNNRILHKMEDVSYQIELEGFDRARDADIIAAAIERPQRLMTLCFDYSPYVVMGG